MTVHCVEVMAAADVNAENVENKIDDLKSKYGEKLPKQNSAFTQTQTLDGTTYYRASFRVTLSDKESEKKDLADNIEKEVSKSASWYRVRWHRCDHDDIGEDGCGYIDENGEFQFGWQNQAESGTIPEGV